MHSPLPDTSALEAGLIEDARPSRLSRVQDNVRNLLRNSALASIHGSAPATPRNPTQNHGLPTPPPSTSPLHPQQHQHLRPTTHTPAAAPTAPRDAATSSVPSTSTSATSTPSEGDFPSTLFPPPLHPYRHHTSTHFNTRALTALNHPDLSDPSLARELARHRAEGVKGKCAIGKTCRRERGKGRKGCGALGWMCGVAALLLGALVATYLVIATTASEEGVSTTFHVLFILGIILATIVLAHSIVRLCLFPSNGSSKKCRHGASKAASKQHRRRHQRGHRPRDLEEGHMPTLAGVEAADFVPATPIPIQEPTADFGQDEVRPDTREAHPTATPHIQTSPQAVDEAKDSPEKLPHPPPPAYGRWRGSVRADPNLLHWQAVPSPVDSEASGLPSPTYESPTYEEAMMAQRTGPPSYVTRESPARAKAGGGGEEVRGGGRGEVPVVAEEPEMVEARGAGQAF